MTVGAGAIPNAVAGVTGTTTSVVVVGAVPSDRDADTALPTLTTAPAALPEAIAAINATALTGVGGVAAPTPDAGLVGTTTNGTVPAATPRAVAAPTATVTSPAVGAGSGPTIIDTCVRCGYDGCGIARTTFGAAAPSVSATGAGAEPTAVAEPATATTSTPTAEATPNAVAEAETTTTLTTADGVDPAATAAVTPTVTLVSGTRPPTTLAPSRSPAGEWDGTPQTGVLFTPTSAT
jgi:hypothetical protein